MKVSIVITAHKRLKLLKETLESVFAQTYSDLEIIVVDDASSDGTKEFLSECEGKDTRFKYVSFDENKGATASRNAGLDIATGDWIMVWDSDDLLEPRAIEVLVAAAQAHDECGIVSAPASVIRAGKNVEVWERQTGEFSYEDILCRRIPYNTKLRLAKKEVWRGVRYVSKNIDFLINVWLRRKARWYHINTSLGTIRMEHDSESLTTKRKMPNAELSKQRANHIAQFLEEDGEKIGKECAPCLSAYTYGAALGLILDSQRKRARSIILTALSFEIFSTKGVLLVLLYILALLPGSHLVVWLLFYIKTLWYKFLRV